MIKQEVQIMDRFLPTEAYSSFNTQNNKMDLSELLTEVCKREMDYISNFYQNEEMKKMCEISKLLGLDIKLYPYKISRKYKKLFKENSVVVFDFSGYFTIAWPAEYYPYCNGHISSIDTFDKVEFSDDFKRKINSATYQIAFLQNIMPKLKKEFRRLVEKLLKDKYAINDVYCIIIKEKLSLL